MERCCSDGSTVIIVFLLQHFPMPSCTIDPNMLMSKSADQTTRYKPRVSFCPPPKTPRPPAQCTPFPHKDVTPSNLTARSTPPLSLPPSPSPPRSQCPNTPTHSPPSSHPASPSKPLHPPPHQRPLLSPTPPPPLSPHRQDQPATASHCPLSHWQRKLRFGSECRTRVLSSAISPADLGAHALAHRTPSGV